MASEFLGKSGRQGQQIELDTHSLLECSPPADNESAIGTLNLETRKLRPERGHVLQRSLRQETRKPGKESWGLEALLDHAPLSSLTFPLSPCPTLFSPFGHGGCGWQLEDTWPPGPGEAPSPVVPSRFLVPSCQLLRSLIHAQGIRGAHWASQFPEEFSSRWLGPGLRKA